MSRLHSSSLQPRVLCPNSDDIATYTWTQVSGPTLSIADNSLAEIDLILPDVISDDVAVLELTVSNGKKSSTAAKVTIAIAAEIVPAPEPEPTPESSGGACRNLSVTAWFTRSTPSAYKVISDVLFQLHKKEFKTQGFLSIFRPLCGRLFYYLSIIIAAFSRKTR